jgi:hypothetical protein
VTDREIAELTGLPWDAFGVHYPERFARVVTALGIEFYQTDEEPEFSGEPFGAKRLDLVWLDREAWVRIDPWPSTCEHGPWFERVASLQRFWPAKVPRPECTGLAATWCPNHGDCSCPPKENGERDLDDPGCPLHSESSDHAERAEDAP